MTLLEFMRKNKEIIISLSKDVKGFKKGQLSFLMASLANITFIVEEDKKNAALFILSYLSIFVSKYGYEDTEKFIISRSMWESKLKLYYPLVQAKLLKGLAAEMIATIENKNCSELTLRPLFDFMTILSSKIEQ